MPDTLVLQSHRLPLPYPWIADCLASVRSWAEHNDYEYRFVGDELFAPLSEAIRNKTAQQIVIASDLARLLAMQQGLENGYNTVVWCDADFLIFDANRFVLPDTDYALGREVWVQADAKHRLRAWVKVHNAFLMFRAGNSFLDFYAHSAERLLNLNTGTMPPQFIGPKLLTALHNIVACPVLESAGMLSPLVMQDLIDGGGPALDLMQQKKKSPIYAANLSSSLVSQAGFSDVDMTQLIARLVHSGLDLAR